MSAQQQADEILYEYNDRQLKIAEMLHLATSFMSTVVKSSIKDNEVKRGVIVTTTMIDLAIDFFCKK